MTRTACILVALGLATAASTALAAQPGKSPVQMTDAQMDDVTAGELIVVFQDSFNDLTINFGRGGGGNGLAKGWESGKGNPHRDLAPSPVSLSKHGQTLVFTVNINVNTASGG